MKFDLEAQPGELLAKGEQLVDQLAHALEHEAPEIAALLHKALPPKQDPLKYPVLQELHAKAAAGYEKAMKAMAADIGKVLEAAADRAKMAKSEPVDEQWVCDCLAKSGRSGFGGLIDIDGHCTLCGEGLEDKLLRSEWLPLPEEIGEQFWEEMLEKSRSHKYIRRVLTGKVKPKYRYYYNVTGGRGLGNMEEFKVGAKFAYQHGDTLGHYEVIGVTGDMVSVRHDETGHTAAMTKDDLTRKLREHHAGRIKEAVQRAARVHQAAEKHGTANQVKRARERLRAVERSFAEHAGEGPKTSEEAVVWAKEGRYVGPLTEGMSVAQAEDAIRHLPVENLAIWIGGKMLRIVGVGYSVPFPPGVIKEMEDHGDAVVTHNHPSEVTFSSEDILLAVVGNVREMRACFDGGAWALRRPGGWPHWLFNAEDDPGSQEAFERLVEQFRYKLKGANLQWHHAAKKRMDETVEAAGGRREDGVNAKGYSEEKWQQYISEAREEGVRKFAKDLGWEFYKVAHKERHGVARSAPAAVQPQPEQIERPEKPLPAAAPALPRAAMTDMGPGGFDNVEGFGLDAADLERQAATLPADREYAVIEQAKGYVLVSRPKAAGGREAKGAATAIFLPAKGGAGLQELPGEWVIMEAGDIIASHDPESFAQREDYPEGVQERRYHQIKPEQLKVDRIARQLEPAFAANTNPGAIDGAPIITEDGIVLGGNGRTMGMQRAYKQYPESAARLKDYLVKQARQFGISPAQVDRMREPILVRRVQAGKDREKLTALGRWMNEPLTQGLDPRSEEVAISKRVTSELVDTLTHAMGADQTLADFLGKGESHGFIRALEHAAIIDQYNRAKFINQETGLLNEDGRGRVMRVLAARLLPDAAVLDGMGQKLRNSLAQAVPFFLQAERSGWDLREALMQAVRADMEMSSRGYQKDATGRRAYLSQPSLVGMEGGGHAEAVRAGLPAAMLELIQERSGPRQMQNVMRRVAVEADRQEHDHGSQGSMFAVAKVEPEEAVRQAITGPKQGTLLAASFHSAPWDLYKSAMEDGEARARYVAHAVQWEARRLMAAAGTVAAVEGTNPDLRRALGRLKAFIADQSEEDLTFSRGLEEHPISDGQLLALLEAQASSRGFKLQHGPALAKAFADVTEPQFEQRDRAYQRVKEVLARRGYGPEAFDPGGELYGKSVNELIEFEQSQRLLAKAMGPFIGPRGGKWADPAHTIPWKESEAFTATNSLDAATQHFVRVIETSLKRHPFDSYGIRVDVVGEGAELPPYKVGEPVEPSRVWVDNDPTEEYVDGASTVGIDPDASLTEQVRGALKLLNTYNGNQLLLVGGDSSTYGEDEGEQVIKNPKVIGVFSREDEVLKSGPFLGPRGGKWADAAHTIPWRENVPHEKLREEAHPGVKGEVLEAAHKAVEAGADSESLRYVGAGGEGILFRDKTGRAYKVGRIARGLEREAQALEALQDTSAARYVPRFYSYDKAHDVLVRDHVEGTPGGWATAEKVRKVYGEIAGALATKEWSAPEFKEDSFIVGEGDPKMVDLGFVFPMGSRSVADLAEKMREPESVDLLDVPFEMRRLYEEGHLTYEQAAAWTKTLEASHSDPHRVLKDHRESLDDAAARKGDLPHGAAWRRAVEAVEGYRAGAIQLWQAERRLEGVQDILDPEEHGDLANLLMDEADEKGERDKLKLDLSAIPEHGGAPAWVTPKQQETYDQAKAAGFDVTVSQNPLMKRLAIEGKSGGGWASPVVKVPDETRVQGLELRSDVDPSRYAVVHRSTKKPGRWQVSWFDKDGPWGDTDYPDLNAALEQELKDYYLAGVVKKEAPKGQLELFKALGTCEHLEEQLFKAITPVGGVTPGGYRVSLHNGLRVYTKEEAESPQQLSLLDQLQDEAKRADVDLDNYFPSGSNHSGEIEGFVILGFNVGVSAHKVNATAEHLLVTLKGTGRKVFLDSGAFSEMEFPKGKAPVVASPISDAEWDERLGLYRRLGKALGRQLYAVAPDRVGDQTATLERMKRYQGQMQELAGMGVNILAPLQKGQMTLSEFDAAVGDALGLEDYVRAIPMKKDATTIEDLVKFLRERPQVKRIHLLGLGPKGVSYPAVRAALEKEAPDVKATMDSVAVKAAVGRQGAKVAKLTAVQDRVREEMADRVYTDVHGVDYTDEVMGNINQWLAQKRRKVLSDDLLELGLMHEKDVARFLKDPWGWLQWRDEEGQANYDNPFMDELLDREWKRHMVGAFEMNAKGQVQLMGGKGTTHERKRESTIQYFGEADADT